MTTILLSGGSADRGRTAYARAAFEFGRLVARRDWTLRTGGGAGLSVMGAASDGALAEGGRVEGEILSKFLPVRHRRLHSLGVHTTFARRKAALIHGADAAAVLPGGYGTLDELGDLVTLRQNGFIDMPIVLVNVAGYFDPLLAWERRAAREGFLYGGRLLRASATPRGAVRLLARLLP